MKRIGLIVNAERDPQYVYAKKTALILADAGFAIYLQENIPELSTFEVLDSDVFFETIDVLITLGGDGTVLRVAEMAAKHNIPILGINLGHLGYLAQLEKTDLPRLISLLNSDMGVEKRCMLRIRVLDNENREQVYHALNDAVLGRQIVSNMLHAKLFSNDEFVYAFRCDGLIFSTPTGSTAYSMSSGGPIADCSLRDIVIFTPVCEHSFFPKSMIFSSNDTLSCEVTHHEENTYLIIDGRTITSMQGIKKILIDKSPFTLSLFQTDGERFYKVLNKKFSVGGSI